MGYALKTAAIMAAAIALLFTAALVRFLLYRRLR